MLDIMYLDNYNKIVFECKKNILEYITYIQTPILIITNT